MYYVVMVHTIWYASISGNCICYVCCTQDPLQVYLFFVGDVWFSLNGTTYQNNSCVPLEDIGENDTALLCMTNLIACYRPPHTGNEFAQGNWFFPNGTTVSNDSNQWDFYRTRDEMVAYLNRRRGREDGIYHCEIPDSTNVIQTIYIGVYTGGTGECYMSTRLFISSSMMKLNEQKVSRQVKLPCI